MDHVIKSKFKVLDIDNHKFQLATRAAVIQDNHTYLLLHDKKAESKGSKLRSSTNSTAWQLGRIIIK